MIGFIEITVALFTVLFSIIVYFKWSYTYWKRKNVPFIEPSIPWGTNENPLKPTKGFSSLLKEYYNEFKSKGHIYGGMYVTSRPALLAVQPDLIKRILLKDFQHFTSHGLHVDEKKDPLSGNLFSLDGEKWRNMRLKLTPTFTSGKMKVMFPTVLICGTPMIEHINNLCDKNKALDIKEILACFTTDVIGSCAFGVDCNSFTNPDAEFRKYGRKIFTPSRKSNLYRLLNLVFPKLGLRTTDEKTRNFFIDNFTNIVNHREETNCKRNDFVQLMLEINQKAKAGDNNDTLTLGQMIAQSIMFFAAGFETSSTTMNFCLHELAHNQTIQEKLRTEINEVMEKYGGNLTYDGMMEMKYLHMVLEETLRKFPAAPAMNRVCTKDYTIEETGVVIEKDTLVFVSTFGLHRDPEYFPNPDKFDPERFSEENKKKINPFAYLPFGDGPRICIGLRFGLMQAKVGLALLLRNYIFTPHKTMRYDMELGKGPSILSFKDDLLLNAKRIN